MALITRTYTFTDGTVAYGSQVDSEIANIVNVINSLDAGTTTWDVVKLASIIPTAPMDFASQRIKNLGAPTTANDAARYPITNAQITSQTIRGSTANSSAAAQEIGQGTVSTPDFRANAVTLTASTDANAGTTENTSITSAAITTIGGKVLITASVSVAGDSGTVLGKASCVHLVVLDRDGTALTSTQHYLKMDSSSNSFHLDATLPLMYIDSPAAGTHTYTLYYTTGGAANVSFIDYHITLVELRA